MLGASWRSRALGILNRLHAYFMGRVFAYSRGFLCALPVVQRTLALSALPADGTPSSAVAPLVAPLVAPPLAPLLSPLVSPLIPPLLSPLLCCCFWGYPQNSCTSARAPSLDCTPLRAKKHLFVCFSRFFIRNLSFDNERLSDSKILQK